MCLAKPPRRLQERQLGCQGRPLPEKSFSLNWFRRSTIEPSSAKATGEFSPEGYQSRHLRASRDSEENRDDRLAQQAQDRRKALQTTRPLRAGP